MAQYIPSADFVKGLENLESNKADTRSFIEKGKKPFIIENFTCVKGYRLLSRNKDTEVRLISGEKDNDVCITVFKTLLKYDRFTLGKDGYFHVEVWRSKDRNHADAVKDLSGRCFIALVAKHGIIISDHQMTKHGAEFWMGLLCSAFYAGYHVYYLDGVSEDPAFEDGEYKKIKINNAEVFYEEYRDVCFGHDPAVHQHRHLVITTQELD